MSDGRWYRALAEIKQAVENITAVELHVSLSRWATKILKKESKKSGIVFKLIGVRYGWGDWPQCTVFDGDEGRLPLLPFNIEVEPAVEENISTGLSLPLIKEEGTNYTHNSSNETSAVSQLIGYICIFCISLLLLLLGAYRLRRQKPRIHSQ